MEFVPDTTKISITPHVPEVPKEEVPEQPLNSEISPQLVDSPQIRPLSNSRVNKSGSFSFGEVETKKDLPLKEEEEGKDMLNLDEKKQSLSKSASVNTVIRTNKE